MQQFSLFFFFFVVVRYYVSNIKRENWGAHMAVNFLWGKRSFIHPFFTIETRKEDVEERLAFGTIPKLWFPQLWFPLTVCASLLKGSEKSSIQNEKFHVNIISVIGRIEAIGGKIEKEEKSPKPRTAWKNYIKLYQVYFVWHLLIYRSLACWFPRL